MTSSARFRDLLPAAILAAKKAGDAILEVYKRDFIVEQKDDRSPLTLADKRSHETILQVLSRLPYPVLSEEGKDIPYKERKSWEYFWLVDPLDGTKEFIKRNGEFTVNIALVHGTRPVLGVTLVPAQHVLYFSAQSMGSYKIAQAGSLRPEMTMEAVMERAVRLIASTTDRRFTVVASRSHMSKETEEYITGLKNEHGEIVLVSAGSSLKFCLVAEGLADAYPRFGPTMEWDTAAGQILVEEAGGSVLRTDAGEPLQYNKPDLHNPSFIVKGRGI